MNEEKTAECIQKNQLVNDQNPPEARNYWNTLPDEVVEMILLNSVRSSDRGCHSYHNIIRAVPDFKLLKKKGKCCFLHQSIWSGQWTFIKNTRDHWTKKTTTGNRG